MIMTSRTMYKQNVRICKENWSARQWTKCRRVVYDSLCALLKRTCDRLSLWSACVSLQTFWNILFPINSSIAFGDVMKSHCRMPIDGIGNNCDREHIIISLSVSGTLTFNVHVQIVKLSQRASSCQLHLAFKQELQPQFLCQAAAHFPYLAKS